MGTQKYFDQKPLSDAPDTAPPHQEHYCFSFHPYFSHTICCLEKTPALRLAQYTKGSLPAQPFHVYINTMTEYFILLYEQYIQLTLYRLIFTSSNFLHLQSLLSKSTLPCSSSKPCRSQRFLRLPSAFDHVPSVNVNPFTPDTVRRNSVHHKRKSQRSDEYEDDAQR